MLTFSNVYFWLASHRESTLPKSAFFDDAELQENALTQKCSLEMMHHKQYFLRNIPSHCQSFPWRCGNISKFGKRQSSKCLCGIRLVFKSNGGEMGVAKVSQNIFPVQKNVQKGFPRKYFAKVFLRKLELFSQQSANAKL